MHKIKKTFSIVILVFLVTTILVKSNSIAYLEKINDNKNKYFWEEVFKEYKTLNKNMSNDEIDKVRNDIINTILAQKTEELVLGAKTDEEKATRIAKWISAYILSGEEFGNYVYAWNDKRSSLCEARSQLFVKMLEFQNIPAKVFNMYDFGGRADNHSCAQVFYNNKWHFFDVTYVGIFMENDGVMSYEKSDNKDASFLKENDNKNNSFWEEVFKEYKTLNESMSSDEITKVRNEIMDSILAQKTEEIVLGAKTDQEKAIRIAKWISANISNRGSPGGDVYNWYTERMGLCSARAQIFIKMLSYQNIDAKPFNMYNFGGVGGGHSCAQVYYDNKWHFFDVTYAGVFIKNGNVMSWEEIVADPKDSLNYIVVFDETLDRTGNYGDNLKVNNYERMRAVYTVDSLTNEQSYGFYKGKDVKTLYPTIDFKILSDKKLELGKIDGNITDVMNEGVTKNISEQLGFSLGTYVDTFHTQWEFKNMIPNKKYIIKYYLYKASDVDLKYWVKSSNAKIISGGMYGSSIDLKNGKTDTWTIEFVPTAEQCSILIGYDFRELEKISYIDKIEIMKVD